MGEKKKNVWLWVGLGCLGLYLVVVGLIIAGLYTVIKDRERRVRNIETQAALPLTATLKLVPIVLPDKSLARLNGPVVHPFGMSMQLPEKVSYENQSGSAYTVSFGAGASLDIPNPATVYDWPQEQLKKADTESGRQKITELYGAETLRSKYAWLTAVLTAVPDEKIEKGDYSNKRTVDLLKVKNALVSADVIYRIETKELRGYQLGEPVIDGYPSESIRHMNLMLFDKNDREYDIQISINGDATSRMPTRAEINAMVASMRVDGQMVAPHDSYKDSHRVLHPSF